MLATDIPVPFPYSGSAAFLRPNADPVQIVQRRPDGRVLVTRIEPGFLKRASSQLTVDFADLAEFAHEAIVVPKRSRPKAPRRTPRAPAHRRQRPR